MINSICIVRLSALGDVLMLVPLVRTLQANLPTAKITWIISNPAYELVAGLEGVEFIIINKPNGLRDYWQLSKLLRGRRFDVLLAAQASFRANLVYPFIRSPRKIGYDRLRAKDGHHWFINEKIAPGKDHTLEGFLKFSQVLGCKEMKIAWDLPISIEDANWACTQRRSASPLLLVNAAASKPERSWPAERYIQVIKAVKHRWHAEVILTGGPGSYDRYLADTILKAVPCGDLVGKTKPKQLLALIRQADVLLCPDTGPAHMAAAVNTPVVALHAVTSAEVSGPYPFKHLAVDCYSEAIVKVLRKTAASNIWGTHVHGEDTMKLVTVAAVMEKLALVFNTLLQDDQTPSLQPQVL